MKRTRIEVLPVTPERWGDLAALFGPRGACGGCWCMFFRRPRAEPGLLAYADGRPVGWCSYAPREEFPALERSRVLAPVDDKPVWSVTCFFVARGYRRKGVTVALLKAAVARAAERGARILEGYPIAPKKGADAVDTFAWTGLAAGFEKAGFTEAARRSPTRPIMRRRLKTPR